jgi:Coenzyme PQQ synthesis protein D (PqqD)
MNEVTLQSRIARNDDIVSGQIDDEFIMMSIESGKYHLMNATGSRIWALLDKPRTVAELCAILTSEFKITPAVCQKEVMDFVTQLISRKIVTID